MVAALNDLVRVVSTVNVCLSFSDFAKVTDFLISKVIRDPPNFILTVFLT